MTIAYRDSSFDRPNTQQAAAAFAAGVRVWGGYLAAVVPPGPRSSGGSNLATNWTQADFDVLRAAGIAPIAFASGWDDAAACGALAAAWRVRLLVDVEDGIRGDGPWVDPWLAASGAGIYGLCSVHAHVAPAHIVARYPGVPVDASSWDAFCPAPAGLLGWQAEGTHTDPATGLQVDAGWVDDGFMEGDMTDAQAAQLQAVYDNLLTVPVRRTGGSAGDLIANLYQQLLDPAGAAVPGGGGPLVAILADLVAIKAELDAIKAVLPPASLVPHDHQGGTTGPAQPT